MTIGLVNAPVTRGARTVRVDRASGSPLGNPYVVGDEEERDAACDAYESLLAEADVEPGEEGAAAVAEIGEAAGFHGKIRRGWSSVRAHAEIARLRRIAGGAPLRLDCWCAPLRCHGEAVARAMARS